MADAALKLVTGNRLTDGAVVYYAGSGAWSRDIAGALLVEPSAGDALLADALDAPAPHPAVAPVLIEAARENGRVVPVTLREKIRARGPTVAFGA